MLRKFSMVLNAAFTMHSTHGIENMVLNGVFAVHSTQGIKNMVFNGAFAVHSTQLVENFMRDAVLAGGWRGALVLFWLQRLSGG